jgi:hypothetical protein
VMDSLRMEPHPRAESSPDNVTQSGTTKPDGRANESGGLTQVNRRLKPLDSSNGSNLVDRGRESKSFEWLSVSVRRRSNGVAVSRGTNPFRDRDCGKDELAGVQVGGRTRPTGTSERGKFFIQSLNVSREKGGVPDRVKDGGASVVVSSPGKPDTWRREAVRTQSIDGRGGRC